MSFSFSTETREILEQVVREPRFRAITTIPLIAPVPIALIFFVYFAFFASCALYLQGLVPLALSMLVNGMLIYAAFTPLHDAVHRSVSSHRVLNDLLGTISCFILLPGITTTVYRYLHLEHHRYSGDPNKDPDDPFVASTGLRLALTLMAPDVLWSAWYLRHWASRPVAERLNFSLGIATYLGWHAIWLTSPFALEFFLLWMIPQRIGATLVTYFFARIQHPEGFLWEESPFQCTVHIPSSSLVHVLMLGQTEHHIHHLMPSVPFYRYHQAFNASRRLFDQQNIPTRSLFRPAQNIQSVHKNAERQQTTITKVWDTAENVRAFELEATSGRSLAAFEPGSHVDVHIGDGLVRQYSLCGSPQATTCYQLACKREPDGRGGSIALFERLLVGETLEISLPRNNFPLSDDAQTYTLVAAGIGVTPILSMAYELHNRGKIFDLHIRAKSRTHLPFADSLENMPFTNNITLHLSDDTEKPTFSPASDLGKWQAEREVYVCGPDEFMTWFTADLTASNWPDSAIFSETFVPRKLDTQPSRAFEVVMAKSNKVLTVAADEYLIDVLNANGAGIPCSCTQGICGSCITSVIGGEPLHRDAILSDAERSENTKMCVCVGRAKSGQLVLDV